MYLAAKAIGWKCAFFYYTLILVGNVIVSAMFIAILLSIFMAERVTFEEEMGSRSKSLIPDQGYWKSDRGRVHPQNPLEMVAPLQRKKTEIPQPAAESDQSPVVGEDRKPVDGEPNNPNPDVPEKELLETPKAEMITQKGSRSNSNQDWELAAADPHPVLKAKPKDVPSDPDPEPAIHTPVPEPEKQDANEAAKDLIPTEAALVSPGLGPVPPPTTERSAAGELGEIKPMAPKSDPKPQSTSSDESMSSDSETFFDKVCNHMRSSSLFIFHRDWWIRKWLANWAVPFDEDVYYLQGEYLEDVDAVDAHERMKSQCQSQSNRRASLFQFIESEKVAQRKYMANAFEAVILVLIILSVLVLIIWDPLNEELTSVLDMFNLVFTCAFTLEALLKIIAMDFVWSSYAEGGTYLSSGWNILDLAVVITSILDSFNVFQLRILQALKVLRALRLLRPLKTMRRNEQLRILVNSLINLVPSVSCLVVFTFFYVFSFGIIATFYFKGKIYECSIRGNEDFAMQEKCSQAGGNWSRAWSSFDNIGESMITLIQAMFKNGWSEVAYMMIDATGPATSPERDHQPAWGLFIVGYMLLGYFVLSEMYLCVLFECFYTTKLELCGALACNIEEQQWINMQRFMLRRNLKIQAGVPKSGIRQKCYEIAQGTTIEVINTIISLAGAILYATKYYMMPDTHYWVITIITYSCMAEMNVHCLIKFLGCGKAYVQDSWNRLDLLIGLAGDVGIFLEIGDVTKIPFAVATALRLMKLLKQLKRVPNTRLNVIVDSIAFIFPSLVNVCIVLALLFMMFAILGVHLFWQVKPQGSLNDNSNFRSFRTAILVVIACATGEDWNGIMQSLTHVEGECVTDQSLEDVKLHDIRGCGTMWAYPYFIIFLIVLRLIGMKLFMVVVVEGYMEAVNENYSIITAKDFETFLDSWAVYDPQGTGWISFEELVYLFFELDPPLGVYDKKLREKLLASYRKKNKIVVKTRYIKSLLQQIDINVDMVIHKNESIVFERRRIQRLLQELKVPLEIGTWRIHFRDICQRMAVRAIMLKKKDNFEYF